MIHRVRDEGEGGSGVHESSVRGALLRCQQELPVSALWREFVLRASLDSTFA
jgi:hypothetical protein